MNDVMLDLETFGTRTGCVIRSIGAIFFDPNSDQLGPTFYVNVDRASCEAAGLKVDPNTEAWWKRQSAEAQAALLVDPLPLRDALRSFAVWWQQHRGIRVWSHGANFDQPILEACFIAAGFPGAPWQFWDSRCTRTLFDLAQIDTKASGLRKGVHHNALDDARFQALCVQKAMTRISVGPSVTRPQPSTSIGSVFA